MTDITPFLRRIVRLANDRDPWKIIVDAFGVAGQVVAQLEEQGVEVHRVTGGEHAEAVGVLMEEVTEGMLRHLGSGKCWTRCGARSRGRWATRTCGRVAFEHRHQPAGCRLSGGVGPRVGCR